jgi:hypothetical protein
MSSVHSISSPGSLVARLDLTLFEELLRSYRSLFWCAQVRADGPHFNRLTELETRAVFGYLHGLFKTVCLNYPIPHAP